MTTTTSDLQVLKQFASDYYLEKFTNSPSIVNSPMVSQDAARVSSSDEGFTATIRSVAELNPRVNVPDESSTNADTTDVGTTKATGIKTIRAAAFPVTDVAEREGQANVLATVAANAGVVAANELDKTLGNIFRGVASREVLTGVGQTSANSVAATGAQVDMGNATVSAFTGGAGKLVDATKTGAAMITPLIKAMAVAFKDTAINEQIYLVTTPEVLAELQAANATGQREIEGSNVRFTTILDGKVVVFATRNFSRNFGTHANVANGSIYTSYFVKGGTVIWAPSSVQNQVAYDRNELAGRGGGQSTLVVRWGGVLHPGAGWTWNGDTTGYAKDSGSSGTDVLNNTNATLATNWNSSGGATLNKNIVPVLHA